MFFVFVFEPFRWNGRDDLDAGGNGFNQLRGFQRELPHLQHLSM